MNYSLGIFDIVISVYVCVMSLKIACPQGMILSQGIIFRVSIRIFLQRDVYQNFLQ